MTATANSVRFASITAALGAALIVAACGGSSPSSSSGSSPSPVSNRSTAPANLTVGDVCKLVTADEASAAVGTTVTNPAGSAAIPGSCFYTSADGSAGVIVFAEAYPDSSTADAVQPNQIAAGFAGMYGIKDARPVSGIGDKAFEYTTTSTQSNSSGSAIFVFKANVLLFIILSPTTATSKVEGLARTAVSRLS